MPLSKAKQAEYQRERRLRLKGVIPSTPSVIPKSKNVIPKIPGLVIEGNKIIGMGKETRYDAEKIIPELPICNEYNFRQFKSGDRVRVKRGNRFVETVVPELDAEGNPIWR